MRSRNVRAPTRSLSTPRPRPSIGSAAARSCTPTPSAMTSQTRRTSASTAGPARSIMPIHAPRRQPGGRSSFLLTSCRLPSCFGPCSTRSIGGRPTACRPRRVACRAAPTGRLSPWTPGARLSHESPVLSRHEHQTASTARPRRRTRCLGRRPRRQRDCWHSCPDGRGAARDLHRLERPLARLWPRRDARFRRCYDRLPGDRRRGRGDRRSAAPNPRTLRPRRRVRRTHSRSSGGAHRRRLHARGGSRADTCPGRRLGAATARSVAPGRVEEMRGSALGSGMVVAPQPEAAEAGIEAMGAGGNAVDAAIAAAFVQTVVDPLMCGISGFGSAGIYMPGRNTPEYIDFHAPAPAAARPDIWAHLVEGEARDGFGFVLKGRVNDIGYQSVCVPAALRAFEEIHHRYGTLPWKEICGPAIEWARNGWLVRPAVERFWLDEGEMGRTPNPERLRFSQAGRRLYCRRDGSPRRVGEVITNPDYAATLALIADKGAAVFYEGAIADLIAEDFARNGGLLSPDDLASYRPKCALPLMGTYRGHRVATNQPPGGGVMLIEMLNILEEFDLAGLGYNTPGYIRVVAEAMKRATIDKDRFVGDPAFTAVPLDRLVSTTYAQGLAGEIRRGERAEVPRLNAAPPPARETTQLSVIDRDGNCVSMTHSLGMPSGVITEGLGFMYNGCMGAFDPRPGAPAASRRARRASPPC